MAYDTADREAHVALATRRLREACSRGASDETIVVLTGKLMTAQRLLRNHLRLVN